MLRYFYFFRVLAYTITFIICNLSFAEPIFQKSEYIGNLKWKSGNILIENTSVFYESENGGFYSVDQYSGKLIISTTKPLKDNYFIATNNIVDDIRKNNNRYTPEISNEIDADDVFLKKMLKVYIIKKEKSKELLRWEQNYYEYNKASTECLSYQKCDKLLSKNYDIGYILNKPINEYDYKIIEELNINIEQNDDFKRDLYFLVDGEKAKAQSKNFIYGLQVLAIIILLFFSIKLIWKVTFAAFHKIRKFIYGRKKDVDEKLKEYRIRKHKEEVMKIAEATIITESIKNEIKDLDSVELSKLKDDIAAAMQSGDYEKVERLLNLAERFKKI